MGPAKHLRAGGIVWFALDQDARRGVLVNFCGQPATTHPGPVRLARSIGAPILIGFVHRLGPGRYELQLKDLVRLPQGKPSQEELVAELETLLRYLEEQIRRFPEDWLWVHRRWRRGKRVAEARRKEASAQVRSGHAEGEARQVQPPQA